ncbi:MAG TPA: cyclic nucleotide-binding domain-containing protein [bacterium]|nr:cyclic nucleotide-binding domain-containing protein [bacterium]HQG44870.1 cyclic nucleotide-binding domain-containing protein [bacterium]HQI47392.1 cyclic nucleotide-binding domain-containing protein [bacterium]HQJ63006.1 cyclic nucleotide-binding domain-containing protein [bacterium]
MKTTRPSPPSSTGQSCTLEELRPLRAFARLLPAALKRIQPWLHVRTYEPGESLYEQGEPALILFFLLTGSLALEIEEKAGHAERIKIVLRGEACGTAALVGEAFYGESCRALEASRVVVLPQFGFEQLLAVQPALACALLQGALEETLEDWRKAQRNYGNLTDHLTRANIIV